MGLTHKLGLIGKELLGIDPSRLWSTMRRAPRFVRDATRYAALKPTHGFSLRLRNIRPLLHDFDGAAGSATGHYFYQDLWAARLIHGRRPACHVDIGSRIDGFIAHLLTFMPVTVIDIRPLTSRVEGLSFIQQDATSLAGIASDSVESLSSLHALEHFGLGRYSDPIDPQAWSKTLESLSRVLKPGGFLYVSVPIGRERCEFNAQRVFSPATIVSALHELQLTSFAAVDDAGEFHAIADLGGFSGARGACGLFEFTKQVRALS